MIGLPLGKFALSTSPAWNELLAKETVAPDKVVSTEETVTPESTTTG